MANRFEYYWHDDGATTRLRRALAISLVLHIMFGTSLLLTHYSHPFVMPKTYQVQFIPYPKGEPQKESPPEAQNVKPEAPKPKPEPPKPKPETAKPEPKPEPKPKPKVEPKPKAEAKKPESTLEPRSKPDKPEARPAPKTSREPTPGAKAGSRDGNDAYANIKAPMKTGITAPEGLPTVLDGWARLVQRKVEKFWQPPAGLRLDVENQAVISFWVDRQGNLIGKPEIVKAAADAELGETGVRAILLAAPLPPLPEDFKGQEQQVIYVFTLVE
jgi:TonB family protein